jgi:hypothetical protein
VNVTFPSFKIDDQKEMRLSKVKVRRFPIITKKKIRKRMSILDEEDQKVFRGLALAMCPPGCILIWKEDECRVRGPLFLHLFLLHVKDVTRKWMVALSRRMSRASG